MKHYMKQYYNIYAYLGVGKSHFEKVCHVMREKGVRPFLGAVRSYAPCMRFCTTAAACVPATDLDV